MACAASAARRARASANNAARCGILFGIQKRLRQLVVQVRTRRFRRREKRQRFFGALALLFQSQCHGGQFGIRLCQTRAQRFGCGGLGQSRLFLGAKLLFKGRLSLSRVRLESLAPCGSKTRGLGLCVDLIPQPCKRELQLLLLAQQFGARCFKIGDASLRTLALCQEARDLFFETGNAPLRDA